MPTVFILGWFGTLWMRWCVRWGSSGEHPTLGVGDRSTIQFMERVFGVEEPNISAWRRQRAVT